MRLLLGALLLMSNEPWSEQRLVEFVWGPGQDKKCSLHTMVSRLRTWFRDNFSLDDAVVRMEVGYRLHLTPECADITRFHAHIRLARTSTDFVTSAMCLKDALDEWRDGVLTDGPEWLRTDPVVAALERERVQCGCDLASTSVSAGRPDLALGHLEHLATIVPYNEVVQARLLALLGACGRRAEALCRYEEIRWRLAEELGVSPSQELAHTHLALLRGT